MEDPAGPDPAAIAPALTLDGFNVPNWLREIGFEEAIPQFRAEKINGEVLLTLTDQDLSGPLKIESSLQRRVFLSEVAKLKAKYTNVGEPLPAALPKLELGRTTSQAANDALFERALNCVVKIFCTSTYPNFSLPWQMKRQTSSTSSGFVIEGRRILGNAHGVTNQTSVRVRRHGDATKYAAKVLHVGHECDLCMLTVEDDKFWEGLEPLEFGDVPRLQESVTVVGYPTGGDNISVTRGVVSRVVVTHYAHSGESLLTLQTDSAINSGNSGGPAIQGSKIVGVAFESLTQAQNIGYVIPIPVVKHFLEDIERNGKYTGFPNMGFRWQSIENENLRKFYKVPADVNGILVAFVEPLADASRALQRGDIITAIDGVEIGDDGTYLFRRGERISFRHLEAQKFLGDECKLNVWRDGTSIDLTVRLGPRISLLPRYLYDRLPSYFVHAGLVFTVLSYSYLYAEFGREWTKKGGKRPTNFNNLAYYGVKKDPEEEVVILTHVLVDDVTIGYHKDMYHLVVEELNGVKIKNLRQLVELVESAPKDGFLDFKLSGHRQLVLDCAVAEKCTPRILEQNSIAHAKSVDLRSPDDKNDAARDEDKEKKQKQEKKEKAEGKAVASSGTNRKEADKGETEASGKGTLGGSAGSGPSDENGSAAETSSSPVTSER